MPYGTTQPPDRGDNPAFTPAEAGTRFSDPEGMQGWVDLCYVKADRPGIDLRPVNRKSNALPLSHQVSVLDASMKCHLGDLTVSAANSLLYIRWHIVTGMMGNYYDDAVDSCRCCGNWCKVTSTTRKWRWRTTSDRSSHWISGRYAPTSTFTTRSVLLVNYYRSSTYAVELVPSVILVVPTFWWIATVLLRLR